MVEVDAVVDEHPQGVYLVGPDSKHGRSPAVHIGGEDVLAALESLLDPSDIASTGSL